MQRPPETRAEFVVATHALCDAAKLPRIPTVAVWPGAEPMMDILWEAYEYGGSHLIEGGRGTCKTLGMAILAWWLLIDPEDKEEFKNIGGSGDQSQHCFEYVRDFLLSTPAASLVDGDVNKKKTKMRDGSTGTVLTHSHKAARGSHPTFLGADEVDEMDWDIIQAYLGSGARAHTRFFCSTSQHPTGPMQRMKDEIKENGFRYHKTTLFEAMRCDRDSCAECIAATKGETCFHAFCVSPDGTHKAQLADGFISPDMALELWRSMDYRTALAELFCEGAKAEGLVFYGFQRTVNVQSCAYAGGAVYAGWDFGFENPTVVLLFQKTADDQVQVIGEYRAQRAGALAENMARSFKSLCAGLGIPAEAVQGYGDPAGRQQIAELFEHGVNVRSARMKGILRDRAARTRTRRLKNPKEEAGGVAGSVALLNRLFDTREDGKPGFIIDPSCEATIRELEGVIYREGTDQIKKENDHGPDALRYGLWSVVRGLASSSNSSQSTRAGGNGNKAVPPPSMPELRPKPNPTGGRW